MKDSPSGTCYHPVLRSICTQDSHSKLNNLPRLPGDPMFYVHHFQSVCFHEVLFSTNEQANVKHQGFTKAFLLCSGYLESCEFFCQDVELKLCECHIFNSKELQRGAGWIFLLPYRTKTTTIFCLKNTSGPSFY